MALFAVVYPLDKQLLNFLLDVYVALWEKLVDAMKTDLMRMTMK